MKRKEEDGWHVYSEKGKHFGGPYKTETEANKRLQQMEFYKKAELVFNKYAEGSVVPFTDKMWYALNDIKKKNIGKTFIGKSDGSKRLMYEGRGLKKFTGKFFSPQPASKIESIDL